MNTVETFEYVIALWTACGWSFFAAGAASGIGAILLVRKFRAKGG